jgi:hypothetical protein
MKLNWMAIIDGFVVAFLIALISGLYLPKMGLIGPVIGGFIAVYMVEVNYTNGILYGGLPISIAGLISAPLLVFLSLNQTNIQLANLNISAWTLTAILYIGAISGFFLFFFIGIISGIIAVAVRKHTNKKFVYVLVAVAVIILVFILSNVVHVGAILSTVGPA